MSAILAAAAALGTAGCSSGPDDATQRMSPERLYAEAKEETSAGNYEKAARLYERLEGRAAGTLLAQQAQLERAFTQWKGGEKAAAQTTLERFIRLHPTSPAIDYALYLQGLVNFNDTVGLFGSFAQQDLSERDQQAARDAYQSFRQLVDQHPQSAYADDARLRIAYIVNMLAEYEVHVARYYYRRGAYLAAANRAQATIKEFQQSPATEQALVILAQSYDRLGLPELRDDARRVLKQNYPDSTGELETRKSRWWQLW